MTTQEQIDFKREFKSLVWMKGEVTTSNGYVKRLTQLDDYGKGSHTQPLLKSLNVRDEKRKRYTTALKGKTYDEWCAFSKRLSTLQGRLRVAKAHDTKARIELELEQLKF